MKARLRERIAGEDDELRRQKVELVREDLDSVLEDLCGEGGLVPIARK